MNEIRHSKHRYSGNTTSRAITEEPDPRAISDKTYFWDRFRGAAQGFAETCWQVFALVVAIRVFDADESLKRYIPAAMGIGLLISPLTLALFNRCRLPISHVVGSLWLGVAACLLSMTVAPNIVSFVAAIALAQVCLTQSVPLLTHIYSHNYFTHERGGRLSTSFLFLSLSGIIFGYFGGELLDFHVEFYQLLFALGALAALALRFAVRQIPSEPAYTLKSGNAIRNLSLVWKDKLFGIILLAWMLMGLGNLMLIPIRVEYIANPDYGINATNTQISVILISTVFAFRLISTKIWGYLFDRLNVITMRTLLNLCFIFSIFVFFTTRNLWVMGVGAAFFGTALGGSGIMWTLYVTKIASPEKVTSYMSVHGFLTGARMTLAPFLGYWLVQISHPLPTAWFAMLLISISTLIFIPIRPIIENRY